MKINTVVGKCKVHLSACERHNEHRGGREREGCVYESVTNVYKFYSGKDKETV